MDIKLKGKNAIVTGSTSGIGEGIAKSLAEAGCNVLINGFGDKAKTDALVKQIADTYKVKVAFSGDDISKATGAEAMIKKAEDAFGHVDILVNNAGIQFVHPTDDYPLDKWEAIIGINLNAAFFTTRVLAQKMRERGFGRIINIASVHGLVASIHKSAYVASKHAIVGLTKVTALENAGSGLTCNAICPGFVHTPLLQTQIEARAKEKKLSEKDATKDLLSEKQPSGELVQVEELGAIAVFLSSEWAKQITGTTIVCDGGWAAQ